MIAPDLRGMVYMAVFGMFVGIPLAIWKLIDVCIWISKHVSVTWN